MTMPLSKRVRTTQVLVKAWHAIRRNAETSQHAATKEDAREFGLDLPRNIRRLQRKLQNGYVFENARGVALSKGKGKLGKRPLVIAPIHDRIVQRAILDVIQDANELTEIQSALRTPTSIGGVRGRGVDTAIKMFDQHYQEGLTFVAGSDISGFFQKIPRNLVIETLQRDTDETEFVELLSRALTIELSNADQLSLEDQKLFPTGEDGVAQGSPLSALAGNVVLKSFDEQMNTSGRGIVCIRYIDDFIIMGRSERHVRRAMASAKGILLNLGMDIYDPETHPEKAFIGPVTEEHTFLGYQLIPGRYPPSQAARDNLLSKVTNLLHNGRLSIRKAVKCTPLTTKDRCYAQTIAAIDNTVRGWRGSFRSSLCETTFENLDRQIERHLRDFNGFYHKHVAQSPDSVRRRALGISDLRHPNHTKGPRPPKKDRSRSATHL